MAHLEYATGEDCINHTVLESDTPHQLDNDLRTNAEHLEDAERAKVDRYRAGIRSSVRNVLIEDLDAGIGGQFDKAGDVTIAKNTLLVGKSIDATGRRSQETYRHEMYHKLHDHLDPVKTGNTAEGETVVTIGNYEFTEVTIHEAITVANTGDEFVSDDYRKYSSDLKAGLSSAGLTMEDAHQAINVKKDLSLIDDASRGRKEYPISA